jgi:hypothetical protein
MQVHSHSQKRRPCSIEGRETSDQTGQHHPRPIHSITASRQSVGTVCRTNRLVLCYSTNRGERLAQPQPCHDGAMQCSAEKSPESALFVRGIGVRLA